MSGIQRIILGTYTTLGLKSYFPKSTNNNTVTLYAVWEPNTNTKYVVKYWKQNLNGDATKHDSNNYTLVNSLNYTGTTGKTINLLPSYNYTGFNTPGMQTFTIAADGSSVVNFYYTRKSYSIEVKKRRQCI